jgi:hypothetical protein
VTFGFNLYRENKANGSGDEAVLQNWAGIASLDSFLTYDLSGQRFFPKGKKYELRFQFKLAPGERAD